MSWAAPAPVAPDNFAGFETVVLPNGLEVWFKHLPGDSTASISLRLAYGSDQDPPGKEELAHFTEHMLFSDHLGRTEEEIKKEVEGRGGIYNGITFEDHTVFFVYIGKANAPFAIDWLYRILSPHEMDSDAVDRQRQPIRQEVGASRPRELVDWIKAKYLDPPILRLPDFWQAEFGLRTRNATDYYPYRSLSSITPDDLQWFYNTYYVPSKMGLTVIGDLDRNGVMRAISDTFGKLTSRSEPVVDAALTERPGRQQAYMWDERSDVLYQRRFKVPGPDRDGYLKLVFLTRWLSERLNDKLRFGDRKATYGMSAYLQERGRAVCLTLAGQLDRDRYADAGRFIDGELDSLTRGTVSPEEFEQTRAAIVEKLRTGTSSAKDLQYWSDYVFYDPTVFHDFPDLVAAFEAMSKSDVEEFSSRNLTLEHQVLMVVHPLPITQALLLVTGLILAWLTLWFSKRVLLRPLDLGRLRYIAKFRAPLPFRLITGVLILAAVAVAGRLFVFAGQILAYHAIQTVDNFWFQWIVYALLGQIALFVLVVALAHIPRKTLLLDDSVIIKYCAYRYQKVRPEDVEQVSLLRFNSVWFSRRIWKCVPLAPGILSQAIYLRLRSGWSYYFRVRNQSEFLRLLEEYMQGPSPGFKAGSNRERSRNVYTEAKTPHT